MKIIVFGGSGFLGSHVADALSKEGHAVTVFDRNPSAYLRQDQRLRLGNILKLEEVKKAMRGHSIVFHFAGLADIEASRCQPLETAHVNIGGTINLLEAARLTGVRRFVFASTLYVYSGVGSFYRVSKQAAESYVEAYGQEWGLSHTILRFGSLYGPRSDERNGMFRLVRAAVCDGIIRYPGDGNEVREYIHVQDAARAAVDVLDNAYRNRCVLISGQHPCRVRDLLEMIREEMGGRVRIRYVPDEASDLHYRITPYSFIPKEAIKLVPTHFVDLGQGVLNLLAEAYHRKEEGRRSPPVRRTYG